jgi:hypothetical protein
MKPVDFRNETYLSIQNRIAGNRAAVLNAWRLHGPCTTEELADRSKLSLLSLRPRTTDLCTLGLVCLAEIQTSKGEGTYRARTVAEHLAWFNQRQHTARTGQAELFTA